MLYRSPWWAPSYCTGSTHMTLHALLFKLHPISCFFSWLQVLPTQQFIRSCCHYVSGGSSLLITIQYPCSSLDIPRVSFLHVAFPNHAFHLTLHTFTHMSCQVYCPLPKRIVLIAANYLVVSSNGLALVARILRRHSSTSLLVSGVEFLYHQSVHEDIAIGLCLPCVHFDIYSAVPESVLRPPLISR